MSNSESVPSGLRIREIVTETVEENGKTVTRPKLDEHGHEIEVSSVVVPHEIEAEGAAAVEMFVAEQRALEQAIAPQAAESAPNPPTLAEGAES